MEKLTLLVRVYMSTTSLGNKLETEHTLTTQQSHHLLENVFLGSLCNQESRTEMNLPVFIVVKIWQLPKVQYTD